MPWCTNSKIPLHKQQSRHWGFHSCARWLVNILKLVSNVELQSAPDNAKYYSSFLSSSCHHSSSSATGLLSISSFGWEIDCDLSSVYRASTYSSCIASTNHAASLSFDPPPSSSCCEGDRFLLVPHVASTTIIWRDVSSLLFWGHRVTDNK